MSLFKIYLKETKSIFKLLILSGIVLTLFFVSVNQLITMSMSVNANFFSSYGYPQVTVEGQGLNAIDEIRKSTDDKATVYLGNYWGVTVVVQDENNEGLTFPRLEKESVQKSRSQTDSFDFLSGNDTTLSNIASKMNVFEHELLMLEQNEPGDDVKIFNDVDMGAFAVFNNSLKAQFLEKNAIAKETDIDKCEIFINNLVATQLEAKIGDKITLKTKEGELLVTVSGIYSNEDIGGSFIGNIDLLKQNQNFKGEYNVYIDVEDYSKYDSLVKALGDEESQLGIKRDLLFEKVRSDGNLLTAVLVLMAVVLLSVIVGVIYSLINLILKRRKYFIYKLKLFGARDGQIIKLYLGILVPFILILIGVSILISNLMLNYMASSFYVFFGSEFVFYYKFMPSLICSITYLIILFVITVSMLGRRKERVTYSLIRGN